VSFSGGPQDGTAYEEVHSTFGLPLDGDSGSSAHRQAWEDDDDLVELDGFGCSLLGAELIAIDAQFYLVFLGISAVLVGLASLFGIVMPEWAQWTAFAVLSLISFFTFRKSLYEKIRGGVTGFRDSLQGDTVTVDNDLAAGAEARIEFRGSKWTVRNVGSETINSGLRARVVRADGLTLHVEAE
jgi:membrane protein implicated in regulation of membrane protease activity